MTSGFTFTNNTYAGKVLAGYMASTLLEGDFVTRGLITVIPNVKKRMVILDVDDSVELQDPSATFVDQNTNEVQTESYLDPVIYEFMKQQSWESLVNSWESEQLKPGSLADYEGVVELSDFTLNRYLTKLRIANESLYIKGKSNTLEATFSASYTGLLPKIKANSSTYIISLYDNGATVTGFDFSAITSAGVVTVASTTALKTGDVVTIDDCAAATMEDDLYGAIEGQSYFIQVLSATTFLLKRNYNSINTRTAASFTGTTTTGRVEFINVSNVMAVLGMVYSQLDFADRIQPDFKLMIPLHVRHAYEQAMAALGTNVLGAFTNPVQCTYLGINMESMNIWLANTILGVRTSNIFLGVDLLSDDNQLSSTYLFPYTGDNVVRTKARMKSDVNAKFFNEILMVCPTGPNNS